MIMLDNEEDTFIKSSIADALEISDMMDQIRKTNKERPIILSTIRKDALKKEKLKKCRNRLLTFFDLLQKKYNIPYEKTPRLLRVISENMYYEIALLNQSISDENERLNVRNYSENGTLVKGKEKLLIKDKK